MPAARPSLIEFPADDSGRALAFWAGVLGDELRPRLEAEGAGWQTDPDAGATAIGVHQRGQGPGDTNSLPYFTVPDMAQALERVTELGGSLIHPGERWSICRDPRAARSRWRPSSRALSPAAGFAAAPPSSPSR